MKNILIFLTIVLFVSCHNNRGDNDVIDLEDIEVSNIQYSEEELITFLDSIGCLPTEKLASKISSIADSVFNSGVQMNKIVMLDDFQVLQQAIKEKSDLDIEIAKRIFGRIKVDSSLLIKGKVPLNIFSFDNHKNDYNEFAICLDNIEENCKADVYFFKKNVIIAKHHIFYRFELTLEHFKDKDNKTVVYYKENFDEGTGVWQHNYFFYKYLDNHLHPVLNVLSDGNLNVFGGRNFYIETTVVKEVPLILKMTYNQELLTKANEEYIPIINDSTLVQYNWNNKSQRFIGNYEKSKISETQILTYYSIGNDYLFINVNYNLLKESLNDKVTRSATLNYLNDIRNGLGIYD